MGRLALLVFVLAGLTGCGTVFPRNQLIADKNLKITSAYGVKLDQLVYWGGVAAIAYYVVDPGAPNWEIQEAKFPEDRYHLTLKMKRYYNGGAGEARAVFQRRARELVQTGGFREFQILEYQEGMDSNVIGSQRTAEGVIMLVRK
ncbi:hypothetical protein [Denitratisoma oestradiolicum]|uniref:Lipoprotein n=1 Tax=Denitratisoma oestradiolicum TaxID=311182 RepID=A0A6S6Y168_9PROT|nr:hypothetical protein [Denitratisoma oestradiolicum]TWO81594.1 hypothetical protein CBW56_02445 [Denitratisoma oestradiolicum]CAB1370531.1 conserved protein of unknown function [Denitratisoma oestradiolicum]